MILRKFLILISMASALSAGAFPTTRPAPAFITAVFQQPVSSFSRWRQRGINTVINTVSGLGQDVPDDEHYVTAAHAAGLYVIADAPGADTLAQRDEADGNGVPAVTTFAKYQAWKQANPAKLVYMNLDGRRRQFTQLGTYRAYFQGADLIGMDRYSPDTGNPEDIPLIGGDIDTMKLAASGKRIVYTLGIGNQHIELSPWRKGTPQAALCRPSTLAELKQQIAICVSHGATGISFFSHDPYGNNGGWASFDSTTPEIAAALPGICASLTGVPIVYPPVITPATKPVTQPVTQPVTPRLAIRTRVLTTGNPTLLQIPNIRWTDDGKGTSPDTVGQPRWVYDFDAHDEMVAMGYEEAWMIGDGTLNTTPMWTVTDVSGNPHLAVGLKHDDLDWSNSGNHNSPPDRNVSLAIGQLIAHPQTFRNNGIKPHAMVIFDIEGSSVINYVGPTSPLADRLAAVNALTQSIKWIRQEAGGDQEVCVYQDHALYATTWGPEPEIQSALAEFSHTVSQRAPFLYACDWQAENSASWQSNFDSLIHNVNRFSPEHSQTTLIILCPVRQVYYPDKVSPEIAKLHGTPIPMPMWMNMIDAVVAKGYSILVWTGNTPVEPIREQLRYAAGYQRGRN